MTFLREPCFMPHPSRPWVTCSLSVGHGGPHAAVADDGEQMRWA